MNSLKNEFCKENKRSIKKNVSAFNKKENYRA